MTDKLNRSAQSQAAKQGDFCKIPDREAGDFYTLKDPGITVDVEIQMGDAVDSQIIQEFMGEFEAARKKYSV